MSQDRPHPDDPALARRGKMIASHRLRHHYLEAGASNAPPVVLLHGLASLAEEIIAPLGQPLARAGYHVIAFDRPGCGQSPAADENETSPAYQARALAEALSRLGLQGAIVVAHSVGAATALLMAEQSSAAVSGLVLVNPFCRPTRPEGAPPPASAVSPVLRRLLPHFGGLFGRRRVRAGLNARHTDPRPRGFPPPRLSENRVVSTVEDLHGFNADVAPLRMRLKRLSIPTIILADPEDPVIAGGAHVRWLTHRMPVQAVRWSSGGHLLHHADPDAVVDAVLSVDVARQVGMRRIA